MGCPLPNTWRRWNIPSFDPAVVTPTDATIELMNLLMKYIRVVPTTTWVYSAVKGG
jgi:hypothetical protein